MHRLLQHEGGNIPLERVTLRVSDYADIGEQEAADLIDEGLDAGIYTLDRGSGGATTIPGVSPQGPEPQIITDAFGEISSSDDADDFQIISPGTESIDEALHDAGITTFSALAAAEVDDIAGLKDTLTVVSISKAINSLAT